MQNGMLQNEWYAAEKRQIDAYEEKQEEIVMSIQRLKLHGRARKAYVELAYAGSEKHIQQAIPKQKFISHILGMVK